jgi:alkylation response protein AidB-like acyl-CoA dehydrogenase
VDPIATARALADEVLFPAALETDAADVVPVQLLDALADAGLYGLGVDADFATVCAVQEALASGCLTTAFVWAQHLGLVHTVAVATTEELRGRWLEPLARGDVRAGLALGGALPQPALFARPAPDGWLLEGVSPFLSGWGRIDVVHAAARVGDGVVWLIVDAVEGAGLGVERLRLVALNATSTVRATFDGVLVPEERETARHPAGGPTPPEVLRLHASLALGVASRCCRLLGASPIDDELAALRAELDVLGPGTAAARSAAGELALRAAAALAAASGSRSLLMSDHAQRLAREALFTLVYALRPESKAALLNRLGAAGPVATDPATAPPR